MGSSVGDEQGVTARSPVRTYVVLAYTLPFTNDSTRTPSGTVMARTHAAAGPLAEALGRARGYPPSATWAIRARRVSACRPGWVLAALARDGAARIAPG